jgi:hypothetical protein
LVRAKFCLFSSVVRERLGIAPSKDVFK